MTDLTFDYYRVSALRPCADQFRIASKLLGGISTWKARGFTFREMADARVPLDDLIWLAMEASRGGPDIARRVRLWGADCAAHVLPIFEREMPGDVRPREAIEAARGFARGTVSDAALAAASDAASDAAWGAAMATARDAAWAAQDAAMAASWDAASDAWDAALAAAWDAAGGARTAERRWQFDRLCCWLSEQEPQDWPMPEEGRS